MIDKRRFGSMVVCNLKAHETLKDKCNYFTSLFSENGKEIKVNFAVFNRDCMCVKIHKSATLMDLLKYVAWSGFRSAINQILLKIEYCIESTNTDTIYNITLANDFNLNILVLKEKNKVESKEDKLAM